MHRPIFIWGVPRSGTTLLLRLFNAAGCRLAGENCGVMPRLMRALMHSEQSGEFSKYEQGNRFMAHYTPVEREKRLVIARQFIRSWCRGDTGMERWGYKEIHHAMTYGALKYELRITYELFPMAHVVLLTRKWMEVEHSMHMTGWWKQHEIDLHWTQHLTLSNLHTYVGEVFPPVRSYDELLTYEGARSVLGAADVELSRTTYDSVINRKLRGEYMLSLPKEFPAIEC